MDPASKKRVLSLVIPAEHAALDRARERIRDHLRSSSVEEAPEYAVDLVLEELAGNAIRHGYEGAPGELRIEVVSSDRAILVRLRDHARAFDPTRHPEPVRAGTLAELAPGGRGISMVRAVVSSIAYERADGENRLEVEVARP